MSKTEPDCVVFHVRVTRRVWPAVRSTGYTLKGYVPVLYWKSTQSADTFRTKAESSIMVRRVNFLSICLRKLLCNIHAVLTNTKKLDLGVEFAAFPGKLCTKYLLNLYITIVLLLRIKFAWLPRTGAPKSLRHSFHLWIKSRVRGTRLVALEPQ